MKIGIVGLGNMGFALINGILKSGLLSDKDIFASEVDEDKAREAKDRLHISIVPEAKLCGTSDLIIIAVKPGDSLSILGRIRDQLKGKVIMSICAGVTIDSMSSVVGSDSKIVRVMPNTPLLVGEGASCIACNPNVSSDEKDFILKLLQSVGLAFLVDETLMDAVTGLSGSGPAYVSLFIEALADGGVRAGLPRSIAMNLAGQTVLGTAKLLMEGDKHPGELKDMVTSPGGTTIEGLRVLEKGAFRGTVMDAVYEASMKSRKLGEKE